MKWAGWEIPAMAACEISVVVGVLRCKNFTGEDTGVCLRPGFAEIGWGMLNCILIYLISSRASSYNVVRFRLDDRNLPRGQGAGIAVYRTWFEGLEADMTDGREKPERLELAIHRSSLWPYLLIGALLGAAFEILVSLPMDVVFRNLFEYIFAGNTIRLTHALAHLAQPGELPAVSLTGVIFGAALGFFFYRLKENQKRLQDLRQEFEIQVAALRHHYKNLALGINGFSGRARRKLEKLKPQLHDCALPDADIKVEIDALEQSLTILAEASQRLSRTLTDELRFLKALQSNGLTPASQDFFPVLRHAIQDLLELRFREKKIRVEINGQPLAEPCAPLVFAFEPYTIEVILQNILSNAMRYGDFIQIKAAEHNGSVRVEIVDNGPGIDMEEIKRSIVSPGDRRGAESTQLGLRVTLHLLEKCNSQLLALSKPGVGATFILEFPKQPSVSKKHAGG